jgi:outer membrane protein OmpA-like peptidoglycan-associated protein
VSTPKGSGTTEFSIISPSGNNYTLNVEMAGYAPQSLPVRLDGASTSEKTVNRTVSLTAIVKAPTVVPIKYVVKVVDSKTNLPIEATVKMESQPEKELVTLQTQGGTAQFPLTSPTIKIYKLIVERDGYTSTTEQVRVEAATTVEKSINKTISLVEVMKQPTLVPLKLTVKVLDGKTKLPLEANLKFESPEVSVQTGATSKANGSFDFSSSATSPKEVILTVERVGYVSKTERFTLEGATNTAKTITRTISLDEESKAPVILPLKLTLKVVDEKTKLPLDADVKIESDGEPMTTGKTAKATGVYVLSIMTPTTKEYTLTAEKSGYVLKSEKHTIEGAGTKPKWVTKTIALQPIVKDEPPVSPTGVAVKLLVTILDKKTSLPIEANVMLQSPSDKSKVEPIAKGNGVYEFNITSSTAKDYKISADREGYVYLAQQIRIEGTTAKEKTISRTLSLQPIAVGTTSVLRNLFFDTGKATIKPESYPELNGFENMMKQNPTIRVEISGHTDDIGDNAFNKKLSQDRANSVKAFLVARGIDAKRLVSIGHGETKPLVSNDDEAGGREINRRVELKILSK